MKAEISKSLVAFFIALEIFVYHLLCLWRSGFAEANRILLCGGVVVGLYFAMTIRAWKKSWRTLTLSFAFGLVVGLLALRSFGTPGLAGGYGCFFRDFFRCDVVYCMDVLFHTTLVESIRNYASPSILVGMVEYMRYHVAADWVMALVARITGTSGMAVVGYLFPIASIPLFAVIGLRSIFMLKEFMGKRITLLDICFMLLFCFVPSHTCVVFFNYFTHSETALLGTFFLLIGMMLLPQIIRAISGVFSFKKERTSCGE